jgi:thiamine-phosphate pyrophosphorylase
MAGNCLLYYITDRSAFPGDESARRRHLLAKIAEAARAGINYIQLREKDMTTRDLEWLAAEAMGIIRQLRTENRDLRTALLINSRTDVALAAAANGIHLPSADVSPAEVRAVWNRTCGAGPPARESSPREPLIAVSCHSPQEVTQAAASGATFTVFGSVFEKKDALGVRATGFNLLRQACRAKILVLALGGVTLQNAESCLDAGAAGVAAIRLFQENNIAAIVRGLRGN